jgi:hypothetical protein
VDPVSYWLRELSLVHEAECTIMLQSKPVNPETHKATRSETSSPTSTSAALALWGAGNSKDTIRAIQARAQAISAAFAKLCR